MPLSLDESRQIADLVTRVEALEIHAGLREPPAPEPPPAPAPPPDEETKTLLRQLLEKLG